ncbi:MAG: hypothetical protein J5678_04655 [Bacteroidaceae bacterium]|nr:hypothetical protein [Bacteroidaceae bacterium]
MDNETLQILNEALAEILKRYALPESADDPVMTDILMQVNTDSGQFTVFDDDDHEIYSAVVEEWIGNDSSEGIERMGATIKEFIAQHKSEIEGLALLKPYSFILVDEEKETIEELYTVDDQMVVLDSGTLMEGLDQDLDDFFANLMKE